MTRKRTASSAAPASRTAFHRKLALMWAIGTVLPVAVLAMLYLLAPLPMTTATGEILRTANRFTGTVVLLHWTITLLVWVASRFFRTAASRPAAWQPVKVVGRSAA